MKRMFLLLGVLAVCAAGCSGRSAVNAEQNARKAAAKEAAAKDAAAKEAAAQEAAARKVATQPAVSKKPGEDEVALAKAALPADTQNDANVGGAPQLELGYTGDMAPDASQKLANKLNRPGDWNQWGGSPLRNSVVDAKVPTEWEIGEFDADTGAWIKEASKNIKWVAHVGVANVRQRGRGTTAKCSLAQTTGPPISSGIPRTSIWAYCSAIDENDGRFLWQDNSEKLHTGRVHDWPLMGICSSPLVEGDRVYYVTSRGEVKCLDAGGFHRRRQRRTVQRTGEVHRDEGRGRRDLGARHDERAWRSRSTIWPTARSLRRAIICSCSPATAWTMRTSTCRRRTRRASSRSISETARCCGPTTRRGRTCCTGNGRRRRLP